MFTDSPLTAEEITAHVGDACPLAREILVLEETASTNDLALEFGRHGAASGLAIFAERQTAGRGRFGRRWESAAQRGLWFSLLVRPSLSPAFWPRLTTWAAVSVAAAVEEICGVPAAIKWPNDVQLLGKKTAGILIETGADAEQRPFAVVGLGVNVNHEPADFPSTLASLATSLRIASARPQARAVLAGAILHALDARSAHLERGFRMLTAEAARRSSLLGRWITVRAGDTSLEGVAEELDDEGLLLLRTSDGTLHRLSAGEATLRGTP